MNKQLVSKGKREVYIQDHATLKRLYAYNNTNDYEINITDLFFMAILWNNPGETLRFSRWI